MRQLRIAHLGAKHTHYMDFTEYTLESPYCELAGVWDDDAEKAQRWAGKYHTKRFDTYKEVLSDSTIDGVIITSSPYKHEELIIAAAKAGKHVYVEQPLAVSVEAANRIRDAIRESGVHFALANPIKRPQYVFAKELADSGLLGEILDIRVRTLHDNSILYAEGKFPEFGYVYDIKESGGGAMNNMGCHGVKLLYWFLGKPVSAFGMYSSYTEAAKKDGIDENAVTVFKFPSGAIGTIETGWVHPRYQAGFEVHGTQGSVVIGPSGIQYRISGKTDGWVTIRDKLLPSGVATTSTYWINNIIRNLPDDEYGIDEAVILTEMICAAYASQGREIKLGEES